MLTRLYWIDTVGDGALAMMPRPRGGEYLADEMRVLQEAGVNLVVSLLTEREQRETDLSGERAQCEAHGIQFLSFPIEDRQVPRRMDDFLRLVRFLSDRLEDRQKIVVHCRAGIGRSALVAAGVLVLQGVGPDAAFERIRVARGCLVPDTEEQHAWLRHFAHRYREMERAEEIFGSDSLD